MNTAYSIFPPSQAVASSRLPKIGDILVSCWGYEQTNASFYDVVGVTEKSVELCELNSKETATDGGMQGHAMPARESYYGDKFRKLFRLTEGGYKVKINSYSTAHIWGGEPVYVSWTH